MLNYELVAVRRTELGLSQRALAGLLGVNYAVILRMERGANQRELPLGQLNKLANILGLGMADLLLPGLPEGKLTPALEGGELTLDEARLLHRIVSGEDVRRALSHGDRSVTLPVLVRRRLIDVRRAPALAPHAASAFDPPVGP